MNINEIIKYWMTSARDDQRVSLHLYEKGDYVYTLFFAHLFLEKLLKALVVKNTGKQALPIHNLRILAKKANLSLSEDQLELIIRVNEYNIRTRYPDFKFELKKRCNRSFTIKELDQTKEFGKWLRKQI